MKAGEDETVADVVKRVRRECNSYPLPTASAEMLKLVREIEAAHNREIEELKNKCEEYERQPELMAETAKAALELLKAQESKIAELRESLQEAINNECNYCRTVRSDGTYGKCEHLRADGECDHLRGVKCIVHKWRKALEGANHEGK